MTSSNLSQLRWPTLIHFLHNYVLRKTFFCHSIPIFSRFNTLSFTELFKNIFYVLLCLINEVLSLRTIIIDEILSKNLFLKAINTTGVPINPNIIIREVIPSTSSFEYYFRIKMFNHLKLPTSWSQVCLLKHYNIFN